MRRLILRLRYRIASLILAYTKPTINLGLVRYHSSDNSKLLKLAARLYGYKVKKISNKKIAGKGSREVASAN